MATQQEYDAFRKQILSLFGAGTPVSGDPTNASARMVNNPIRLYGGQSGEKPAWYSDILGVLRPSGSVATDEARDRIMSQVKGTLAQNSNEIRSIFEGSRQVKNDPAWMEEFNTTFGNLSGTAPNQFIDPTTGQGGPVIPQTPTTPETEGPYVPPGDLSTPEAPVNVGTAPSDISQFIPATSEQQANIIRQAIEQSRGVATDNLAQLRGVIDPYIQEQFSSYTSPTSSRYQEMVGQLNNVGMANSGAFESALADKLAPLISQGAMQLGTGALLPSFLNQQGLVGQGAGVQSTLGLESLNRYVELANFEKQKQLANELANKGASAQLGSGLGGLLGGGLGAFAGNAIAPGIGGLTVGALLGSQGGQAAGGGMSWICTKLKKLGLATEKEVENVHKHLRSSIWRHPYSWLHYILFSPVLIRFCDEAALDWKEVKPVLIDAVLAEPDTEKAWQIYRAECQRLTLRYAPSLWGNLEVVS